jgi:hypothetical protein
MAYIPDEWVLKRLPIAQSAQQILFYYCARADQDTGETIVSAEKTSQDLGTRKDHVNEHDRKLVRLGFIAITANEHGGRIVRMLSPWKPRAERSGNGAQRVEKKAASQDLGKQPQAITQDLGSPLDSSPRFGEIPQDLGNATQTLGEVTQDLGKSTQDLGAHIRNNQLINQPIEPERESTRARGNGNGKHSLALCGPNDDFDTPLPVQRPWTLGERFILKACKLWETPILETNYKLRQSVQACGKWLEQRVDPKKGKGGRPELFQEFWFQVLKRNMALRPEYVVEQWDAYDRWLIENHETHRQGANT